MKWFDIKNRNYWRVSGKKEYSIQEVADLTGITVRSLRNYIKAYEEVLIPKRGYYNSLIFSENDLKTFVIIKTCIKDGFRQDEIIKKVKEELVCLAASEENKKETIEAFEASKSKELIEDQASTILEDSEIDSDLTKAFIAKMGKYFISLEQRNILLENRLDRMEKLLIRQIDNTKQDSLIPKTFKTIKDSSIAFWQAISRSF